MMSAPACIAVSTRVFVKLLAIKSVRVSYTQKEDAREIRVDSDFDGDRELPSNALLRRPNQIPHRLWFPQQSTSESLLVCPTLRAT